MSESNPEKQNPFFSSPQGSFIRFINRVPPILSFASLFLGLILTATSIIHNVSESRKWNAELYDSDVKLGVQYIDIKTSVFNAAILGHIKPNHAVKNYTLESFRVLKNNILQNIRHIIAQDTVAQGQQFPVKILPPEIQKEFPDSVSVWQPAFSSVVLLSIEQKGKRRAKDVQIEANYINMGQNQTTEFYTTSDLNANSWTEEVSNNENNKDIKPLSIQLGDLDTGDGILVPLFVTFSFSSVHGEACCRVIMNSMYIPLKIIYTDDFDNKKKEINIRPMLQNSLEISADIETRG